MAVPKSGKGKQVVKRVTSDNSGTYTFDIGLHETTVLVDTVLGVATGTLPNVTEAENLGYYYTIRKIGSGVNKFELVQNSGLGVLGETADYSELETLDFDATPDNIVIKAQGHKWHLVTEDVA